MLDWVTHAYPPLHISPSLIIMAFSFLLAWIIGPSGRRYRWISSLKGQCGPIRVLAMTNTGTTLASGGDDGVRLWDLPSRKLLHQPCYHQSRGPTSALIWATGTQDSFETLVFGTGTGYLVIWRQNIRQDSFIEISSRRLPLGQEITALAKDPSARRNEHRLAVGTDHTVHVFDLNTDNNLISIHSLTLLNVVPRYITFNDGSTTRDYDVYSLHDGKRLTIHGETHVVTMTRDIGTPLGSVDIYEDHCVVDNGEAFSLHNRSTCAFIRLYPTLVSKRFPRSVSFAERGTIVVGGSDHGVIYVFDAATGATLDTIRYSHGLVQTITCYEAASKHYIAAASSEPGKGIRVYEYSPNMPSSGSGPQKDTGITGTVKSLGAFLLYVATIGLALAFILQNLGNVYNMDSYGALARKYWYHIPQPDNLQVRILQRVITTPPNSVNTGNPTGIKHLKDSPTRTAHTSISSQSPRDPQGLDNTDSALRRLQERVDDILAHLKVHSVAPNSAPTNPTMAVHARHSVSMKGIAQIDCFSDQSVLQTATANDDLSVNGQQKSADDIIYLK